MADWPIVTWALLFLAIGLAMSSLRWMRRPGSQRPQGASNSDWGGFSEGFAGYLETDRHGIVQRVNRTACELLGVPANEVIGRHLADLEPADARERCRLELSRKLSESVPLMPYERKLLRPDGTIVTVRMNEQLLSNKTGVTVGMRSAILDITDQLKTKEKALETASELKALSQAFPDLFLRFDTAGNVVDCKRGDPKDPFFGPVTFLGRQLQDILPPDAARLLTDAAVRVRKTNALEVVEYTAEVRHSKQVYECRVLPLYWDHTVAIVRNVTDRKFAERKLEQYAQARVAQKV